MTEVLVTTIVILLAVFGALFLMGLGITVLLLMIAFFRWCGVCK